MKGKIIAVQRHRLTAKKRLMALTAHGMLCRFG
jgi:hypothetical protein